MTKVEDILKAMRADGIPAGWDHLWRVDKFKVDKIQMCDKYICLPGNYTALRCLTDATIHTGGEVVMADYEQELLRHMDFILKASGRVLVSGLGLGCVVRGLLCKSNVASVDIIEKSRSVVKLVWPHMQKDRRLRLIHCNALHFKKFREWDYAWHDIWTPGNAGLHKMHTKLILKFRRNTKKQGAWNMPRELKRVGHLVG